MTPMEKIVREVAEAEFDRFAEFARLKLDSYRSEGAQEKIMVCREHFVEAVMDGRITVDGDGAVDVKTESEAVPVVRFSRRPQQYDRRAMDKVKLTALEAKEDAYLGSVCGIAPSNLSRLEQADLRLIKEVFHLFLDE